MEKKKSLLIKKSLWRREILDIRGQPSKKPGRNKLRPGFIASVSFLPQHPLQADAIKPSLVWVPGLGPWSGFLVWALGLSTWSGPQLTGLF